MSWMKSFFGKSSNSVQKVNGKKFVPSLGGQLEDRKLLATVTASAGSYTVIVSTINNPSAAFDNDIVATLKSGSKTIKSNIPVANSGRYEDKPCVAINVSGQFVVAYTTRSGITDTKEDIELKVFNNKGLATYTDNKAANSPNVETVPLVGINSKGSAILAYAFRTDKGPLFVSVKAVQYNYTKSGIFSSYTKKNATITDPPLSLYDPTVATLTSVGITPSGQWAVVYTGYYTGVSAVSAYVFKPSTSTGKTYSVSDYKVSGKYEYASNGVISNFTDTFLAVKYYSALSKSVKFKFLNL